LGDRNIHPSRVASAANAATEILVADGAADAESYAADAEFLTADAEFLTADERG
jgi:hypothetical protein